MVSYFTYVFVCGNWNSLAVEIEASGLTVYLSSLNASPEENAVHWCLDGAVIAYLRTYIVSFDSGDIPR